jgi:hypothetical protein
VVAASAAGSLDVIEVRFARSDPDTSAALTYVRPGFPRRVPAGGVVDFNYPIEIVTDAALDRLYVRVSYEDQAGQERTVVADTAVPALSHEAPDAKRRSAHSP